MRRELALLLAFGFLGSALGDAKAATALDRILKGEPPPFPVSKLVERIEATENLALSAKVVVPFGRSLQKDLTDFSSPRFVYGAMTQYGPVFIGFSERAEQLEQILWNADERRFEFRIVTGYAAGKKPVTRAGGPICATCHQHGGPIFTNGPWGEMSDFQKNAYKPGILSGLRAHFPKGEFQGAKLEEEEAANNASRFQFLAENVGDILQAQRVCSTVCGTDLACRTQVVEGLFGAISKEREVEDRYTASSLELDRIYFGRALGEQEAQAQAFRAYVAARWSEDGFGFPSPLLTNRDPLAQDGSQVGTFFRDAKGLPFPPERDPTFETFGGFSAFFADRGSVGITTQGPLPPELAFWADPKTPRPLTGRISAARGADYLYESCAAFVWGNRERIIRDIAMIRPLLSGWHKQVKEAVRAPGVRKALQESWPPVRSQLIPALAIALGMDPKAARLQFDALNPPDPSFGGPVVEPHPGQPPAATKFQLYCSKCHAPGERFPLPLEDLEALRAYRTAKGETVWDRLAKKEMPPKKAPQPESDSEGDQRPAMMEAVKPD